MTDDRVASGVSRKPGELVPQSMVALTYGVPLDLLNSVAGGSTYTAKIKAVYQDGYTGSGPFTMQAWVSNDDGKAWTDLGTHRTNKTGEAPSDITTPKGTKAVTLRVKAADTQGSSIDQTVTNAWNDH
jgi:hypothetical protein